MISATAIHKTYPTQPFLLRDATCPDNVVVSITGDDDVKQSDLKVEFVRDVLAYDPQTGIFTWKKPTSAKVSVGSVAGVVATNGRRYIGVLGERHSAHRLAWFYHYGEWPTVNVRQENGNYDDVRIANLIQETPTETALRGSIRSSNKSGVTGVSWSADKNKWIATITRDYKRVHLGYFSTIDEAKAAYEAARAELPEGKGTAIRSVDAIADRRRIRAVWKRLLRQSHNQTGWSSFNVFIIDVGEIPGEFHFVEPIDAANPVGPGNWHWIERRPAERYVRVRADRKARPEVYRAYELRKSFGLERHDIDRMLLEQGGVCAVCKQPETSIRDGNVKALATDHDHALEKATGRIFIRGGLCSRCNPLIGFAQEDPERMQAAIDFVILCRDLFAKQEGKCAICKKETQHLLLDRSIAGAMPRGLVCLDCKHTIVFLGDDPEKASRMADFLTHYRRVPGSKIEDNLWEPIPKEGNVLPFTKDTA
jgi:recombination endonuclease VII/HNH endonuclease